MIADGLRTDPVLQLLATEGDGYRDLYYRWEQQQWEATQISLEDDAARWDDLDPILRRAVGDATDLVHLRANTSAGLLVRYVDAAPSEEIGVFLTTQLVDEARHLVFADRYGAQVRGRDGAAMDDRGPAASGRTPAGRLMAAVADGAEALRTTDPTTLVAALGSYQLAVVGGLGLTLLPFLIEALEGAAELPGWRSGMELVTRDTHRHVAFALRVLAEHDPGSRIVRGGLDLVMPAVRSMLAAFADAAPLRGAAELGARSDALIERWLAAIGGALPG